MALASDLAAAFSLIQQQQALEERKEERHQDLALQLLVIDINKEESISGASRLNSFRVLKKSSVLPKAFSSRPNNRNDQRIRCAKISPGPAASSVLKKIGISPQKI